MRQALTYLLSASIGCSIAGASWAESEYESWLKANRFDAQAAQQEFQDYMDANDKEFVGFLKQQWKKVDLEQPIILDTTPKPTKLPILKPPAKAPETTPSKAKPTTKKPEPIVNVRPIKPSVPATPTPRPTPIAINPSEPMLTFEFLGRNISMPKVTNKALRFNKNPNSKSIAKHWESMASQKHAHIIKAIQTHKKNLNLNDWAVALLAFEYSKALGLSTDNTQQLFTWFLMVKSGYDVRLAYNSSAFILLPSKQALFGVTYFTLKHKKYYAVSFDNHKVDAGRAYTYSGTHDTATKNINFSGASNIKPSNAVRSKVLSFKLNGEQHKIDVNYDLAMVKFSNSFPQMNIEYYPQQGLPANTAQQLLKQLKPLVNGKTEVEAVNLILRFVQTSFAYQTDGKQFNKENYLLPIETLHYPYSDCEDRASLFSWLVEDLLGLDAVLLDYPGHIAAAVKFTKTPKGDMVYHKGNTYTVTDPTYINASVGMAMPQFKDLRPKILNF
jgi:hypothetical protein